MRQKEIQEYNKRCAEFLGYVNTTPTDKDFNIHENNKGKMIETNFTNIFTNDWNAIMEVVEKIEEVGSYYIMEVKCFSSFIIEKNSIKYYYQKDGKFLLHLELIPFISENVWKHPMFKEHIIQVFDFKNKTKKEAVVQAINQFLIFYNENNK